jgi:hypothetical protein
LRGLFGRSQRFGADAILAGLEADKNRANASAAQLLADYERGTLAVDGFVRQYPAALAAAKVAEGRYDRVRANRQSLAGLVIQEPFPVLPGV